MNVHLSQKLRIISFISIILVVLIHSQFLAKETFVLNRAFQFFFSYGITTVAVPFFFSISGYLFFSIPIIYLGSTFLKLRKELKQFLFHI